MRIIITDKSFSVLSKIIEEADEYIKLASFLFYDENLCNLLVDKRKSENLDIEVLTTPSEAAEKDELKEKAQTIQGRLEKAGIGLTVCDYEVGQPELTISTRAGGRIPRWFGMHAKFLVTDNCALVTSSDVIESFSSRSGWDTHVIYKEKERLEKLLQRYEELKSIRSKIDSLGGDYVDQTVKPRKLVRGYPLEDKFKPLVEDGFYLLPHDGGGRKTVEEAIQHAEDFVYLLFETIYENDLSRLMMEKLIANPTLDFRIITSPLTAYVQNPAKTRATFLQLASYGAKINTLENLRAKMLITDKMVISGSFDLVKIGIGFKRGNKWVESTEIMDVNTDSSFIHKAKAEFLNLFEKSTREYGKWFMKEATEVLHLAGATRVSREAKELLGHMIFHGRRQSYDRIKKTSLIAVEIARLRNKDYPYVKVEDVQKADQILILRETDELDEKNVRKILSILNAKLFLERLEEKIFD